MFGITHTMGRVKILIPLKLCFAYFTILLRVLLMQKLTLLYQTQIFFL